MSTDANTQGDMMDRELRPDAGVTLVEMMVVIVIIGLQALRILLLGEWPFLAALIV